MTFSTWSQSALLYASAMEGNRTFHNCKFQNLSLLKIYQWFYYNKEIKIWVKPLFSFSDDDNVVLYLWFELYFGISLQGVKEADYSSETTRLGKLAGRLILVICFLWLWGMSDVREHIQLDCPCKPLRWEILEAPKSCKVGEILLLVSSRKETLHQ